MITHTGDISYSCDMYGKKFTYKWQFKWVRVRVRVMVFNVHHFQQYISYIVAVSFIGGGNQSFGENYRLIASPLQTLYWEHLSWAGFQLTTVMGIGTDCIVSCKSNYHLITTAPKLCNTVSIKQKYTIYNVHAKKLENKSFIFDYLLLILSPCSNVLLFLTHNAYMFLTEFYCTKKKHSFSSWWMYNHQDRRFYI